MFPRGCLFLRPRFVPLIAALISAVVPAIARGDMTFLTGTDPVFSSFVPVGSSAKLWGSLDGPGAARNLQWLFNGSPIPGANGSEFLLSDVTPAQSGNYRLTYTDASGMARSTDDQVVNVVAATVSPVDRAFSSDLGASVDVRPLLEATNGAVIASLDDSATSQRSIVRLDSKGRLDPSFVFPAAAGDPLAVLKDGGLLTTTAPFRLAADGSPHALALPAGFDPEGRLSAAATYPDGRFIVAQGSTFARFQADGSLDPTLVYGGSATDAITGIVVDSQERIFTRRQPLAGAPRIERLTSAGAPDPGFVPPSEVQTMFDVYRTLTGIVPQTSGGYLAFYDRVVVKLRDDGSRDESWGMVALPVRTVFSVTADHFGHVLLTIGGWSWRTVGTVNGSSSVTAASYLGAPHDSSADAGVSSILATSDGALIVSGHFADWDGHPTRNIARLRPDDTAALPPVASITQATPFKHGTDLVLSAGIDAGTAPFTYQWLALDGQPLPAQASSATLDLGPATMTQFGRYQVRVTGPGGTTLSPVLTLRLADLPVHLANISGRAIVGTGEDTLIVGHAGSAGGGLLVRGLGPGLHAFGVESVVRQPLLELYSSSGAFFIQFGAWNNAPDITATGLSLGAYPLETDSADAAGLIASGEPLTVHLRGQPAASPAVGLLEMYGLNPNAGPTNLSLRAHTAPGDATAIAGFVIADPTDFGRTAKVVLRAIGSFAPAYGITHPLENPALTVFDAQGRVVARNDDWQDSPNLADLTAALNTTSGLPGNPHDAALLLTLPPGAYTMHATGGSGVVLLDVFLVP